MALVNKIKYKFYRKYLSKAAAQVMQKKLERDGYKTRLLTEGVRKPQYILYVSRSRSKEKKKKKSGKSKN